MKNLEYVEGCKLGLGRHPLSLPEEVCLQPCDWKISSKLHNNCMWVLCSDPHHRGMSLRKIANMLGMTHESVRQILRSAMKKLPENDFQMDQLLDDSEDKEVKKRTGSVDKDVVSDLLDLVGD